MWYEHLEKNDFIKSLYSIVPDLVDVRIENINILMEGTILRLSFDMPSFPENIPKKWIGHSYKHIHIILDFFDIYKVDIRCSKIENKKTTASIKLVKIGNKLHINLNGDINSNVIVGSGLIQSIKPY